MSPIAMRTVLLIFLILISASIVVLILLQQKGSGVGSALGGGGGGGGGDGFRSQRGVEKIFHNLTVILVFIYTGLSLGLIFVE